VLAVVIFSECAAGEESAGQKIPATEPQPGGSVLHAFSLLPPAVLPFLQRRSTVIPNRRAH
jgi:hypothetical protein